VAEAAAAGDLAHTVAMIDGVRAAVGKIGRRLAERPGARVRRVRRSAREPLASLDGHPEARRARPVEIGLRTIDVEAIYGTAVGGLDQRGGDFLPLRPFRSGNWRARWQRLREANEQLAVLPPIDVVKFDGGYWVIDGHNRVALALYAGQPEIDATVVELVPEGGTTTEPRGSLAATSTESAALRAAASPGSPPGPDEP
jgi:hypothetical protein